MQKADILKYFQAERSVRVEPGQDISKFLEENDLLAVLKSGEAQFVSAGGGTSVMLKPGTPLGMLRGEISEDSGRVMAVTACELIPQNEQDLNTLIEFNPRFTADLLGVLRDTLYELVRRLP